MDKQEVIDFSLTLPNTFEDRPFLDDYESVVMKHTKVKELIEQSYEFTKNFFIRGEYELVLHTQQQEKKIIYN